MITQLTSLMLLHLGAWIGVVAAFAAMLMGFRVTLLGITEIPSPGVFFFSIGWLLLVRAISKACISGKPWGRYAAIMLGCLYLPAFPLGTVIGALTLYGLTRGWNPLLCDRPIWRKGRI